MPYYINNSSRRFPQPTHEEMERRWPLGNPQGAVCNFCGAKSDDGRLVNGLCRVCRNNLPIDYVERNPDYLDLQGMKEAMIKGPFSMKPIFASEEDKTSLPFYPIDLNGVKTMDPRKFSEEQRQTIDAVSEEDAILDESMKESEERDLDAESKGEINGGY